MDNSHWYNGPIGRDELCNALYGKSKVRDSMVGTGVIAEGSKGGHCHSSVCLWQLGSRSMLISKEEKLDAPDLKKHEHHTHCSEYRAGQEI